MKAILLRGVLGALLLASLPVARPHGSEAAGMTQKAGGPYTVSGSSAAGGGVTFLEGGGYRLGNTLGQASAGSVAGSGYELHGGFWSGAGSNAVFRDGFESGDTSRWSATQDI